MSSRTIALLMLTLAAGLTCCTRPAAQVSPAPPPAQPQAPQTPAQPAPEVKPETATQEPTTPQEWVDHLIPGMSAPDPAAREKPQRKLEELCLNAARPGAETERRAMCAALVARLGPETPPPARVWMLRQLALIGGEESVPELAALLKDRDPEVRETSRRALQHNPAPSAAEALRYALDHTVQPAWRVALINALAARGDQASTMRFAMFAQDRDPNVSAAAIAALAEVGGDRAVRALTALWRQPTGAQRELLAAALVRCAERMLGDGARPAGTSPDQAQAIAIFQDVLAADVSMPVRIAALAGLTRAQQEAVLPRLLKLMQQGGPAGPAAGAPPAAEPSTAPAPDTALALQATQLALGIPGENVTRQLAEALPDMPAIVQAALLDGLGERGDPLALPAVLAALRPCASSEFPTPAPAEETVCAAAIRALGKLGDADSVMVLAKIAAAGSDLLRDAARRSLDRLRGPGIDERILAELGTQTAVALRCELIRSLAGRWCRPAIPTLLEAAQDAEEAVRVAAFEALGRLALPQHLPQLVQQLVVVQGAQAREAAENAVVDTASRVDDVEQRALPVLAVLDTTSGAVKASLIRVLGRLATGNALPAIRAARASPEAEVADAAVRALADWPALEVLDDLLSIAQSDADEAHRVLALRGYVRLVRLPSQRPQLDTCELLERALELARRAEEKKLVLAGLGEVRHARALELAEAQLGDETLRDEAGAAVLSIARALAAEQPELALAAIEKVRSLPVGDKVQQQAQQAAEFIERFRGYCAAWLVAGPYAEEGKNSADLYNMTFPPELPDAAGIQWRPLAVNNNENPWVFDLLKALGGVSRCAYARTRVWCDRRCEARLEIGSDDCVKVWLNGRLVHANQVYRVVSPAEDKVNVTLEQGWNTLLLKIVQGGGGWGFCVGFKAPDGGPLEGLRFAAE